LQIATRDLAEKKIFCITKQGKKTREVTSPGPWPLIPTRVPRKKKLAKTGLPLNDLDLVKTED
jgi:hypothetical protein